MQKLALRNLVLHHSCYDLGTKIMVQGILFVYFDMPVCHVHISCPQIPAKDVVTCSENYLLFVLAAEVDAGLR